MNRASQICASCKRLNSATDKKCFHCGASLQGVSPVVSGLFAGPRAATRFLVGLCLFDFALLVIMNGSLPWGFFGPPLGLDARIGAGALWGRLAEVQPWRLLSAVFVHFSVLHLGMNMFALQSLGRVTEEKFGGARLVVAFVVTGVLGFVASWFWYGPSGPSTAGASGAIFGLIGIEVGYLVSRRDPGAKDVFVQNLIMAVAIAFIMPVNNPAHAGGFLAGFALGFLLDREKRARRRDFVVQLVAAAMIVAAVASIALSLLTLYLLRAAQ